MENKDAVCRQCGRRIRIVKGKPALCRECSGPHQNGTARSEYFRKGTRIIALGSKKNDKRKKWLFW
jgi:hypothetical protein